MSQYFDLGLGFHFILCGKKKKIQLPVFDIN